MTDMRVTRQLYLKQPRGDFSCHDDFEAICLKQGAGFPSPNEQILLDAIALKVPSLANVTWQRCQGTARLVSVLAVMMAFELLANNERVVLRDLPGLEVADFCSNALIAATWLLFVIL
jgi:hypothetical protein